MSGLRPTTNVVILPIASIPIGGNIAFSSPPLGAGSLFSIFSYLKTSSGISRFRRGERRYSGKSCGFSNLRFCSKKKSELKIISFEKVVIFHCSGRLSSIKSGVRILSPTLTSRIVLVCILSSL